MYNTIIFDLDGTLLYTLEDLTASVNYVQRKYNEEIHSLDQVRRNVGNGIRNLMKKSVSGGEDNPIFEDAYKDFKEYYWKHNNDNTRPYDGIMELLQALKDKNIKMAIVSNKAHPAVVDLNEIFFKDYIDVAIGENEANGIKRKPAADEVELALERLGTGKEDTLYVGDSNVDKETADNSRLDCVLCSWGFRDKEELEKLNPKAVINSPLELLELI